MTNVVIWDGPIWAELISPAVPKDWTIKTYSRGAGGGIGSEAFKNWALSLGSDPLSKLAPGADRIILAGFSAGHGANNVILDHVAKARDQRLVGLLCADSYYSALNVKTPKPGFLAWCEFAMEQGFPAWFTSSTSHRVQELSGRESILPLVEALDLVPRTPPKNLPVPDACRGREKIVWLDYGARFQHEDHAKVLARQVLAQPGIFFDSPQTNRVDTSESAPSAQRTNPTPQPQITARTNRAPVREEPRPDKPRSGVGPVLGALAVLGLLGGVAVAASR